MIKIDNVKVFKNKDTFTVFCDITAPIYWWNSLEMVENKVYRKPQQIIKKIESKKEFTLDDFSHEMLFNAYPLIDCSENYLSVLEYTIKSLNHAKTLFLGTRDIKYYWQIVQLLPLSFNEKIKVKFSKEELLKLYSLCYNKIGEWYCFCKWVEEIIEDFNACDKDVCAYEYF